MGGTKRLPTSMEFTPPGFRITKVCMNCAFFTPRFDNQKSGNGYCLLERQNKKDAPARPTHWVITCDAHIYKNVERTINRVSVKYGVAIPEETAL